MLASGTPLFACSKATAFPNPTRRTNSASPSHSSYMSSLAALLSEQRDGGAGREVREGGGSGGRATGQHSGAAIHNTREQRIGGSEQRAEATTTAPRTA